MKINLRGVSLAALLLSASGTAIADQGTNSVGDLPGYGNSTYYAEEATYAQRVGTLDDGYQPSSEPGVAEPISVGDFDVEQPSELQQTAFIGSIGNGVRHRAPAYRNTRSVSRRMSNLFDGGDSWVQAEALLWFPQARSTPALITSAAPGVAPDLPTANVEFGGESGIDGGLSAGFRVDAGKYLTDDFGIGGRFWILHENDDARSMSDNGTNIAIGRPFYNTNIAAQDSVIVSQLAAFSGSVSAESSLNMWAAEAYARIRFGSGSGFRTDLIGGYTHFDIQDELYITSTSIQTNPATGETTVFTDNFDANNRFDGGQLGFESIIAQGKWTLRTLTKVHLGNMNQQVTLAGNSSVTTPPGAPAVQPTAGMLVLDNAGTYERNEFAFAPEVNLKLAYRFRPNVLLSVGYSFLYWDNVAQAGDYVDPQFDGSTLNTAGPYGQEAFAWKDSSLWTQGIDLGFVLDY